MCAPSRLEVLRLYKNLLRYGRGLKYTNKEYYYSRIREEFLNNKEAKENDLTFSYKRISSAGTEKNSLDFSIIVKLDLESHMFQIRGSAKQLFWKNMVQYYSPVRQKIEYDRSKVPKLNPDDLEEKYIKGSGPGGSRINKISNCVSLRHKPTGIIVKCQQERDRELNRKIAREMLITKLDNLYNGEDSVENQKKRILEKKSEDKKRKRKKLLELRELYKKENEEDVRKS